MILKHLGFKIGHVSKHDEGTGLTVILCEKETYASYSIHGEAPGTFMTDILSCQTKSIPVNALLITGGSTFGLESVFGVMHYLYENGIGYRTSAKLIPIVPSAVIYDLNYKSNTHPTREDGYTACKHANYEPVSGSVGAGTGATCGKWYGFEYSDKSGVGYAHHTYDDLHIFVLSVVNPVGDIIGTDGTVLAGARDDRGYLRLRKRPVIKARFGENTTIVAILTNARLDRHSAYRLSKKAYDGIARSIVPSGTIYDGDIAFVLYTNEVDAPYEYIHSLVPELVSRSIMNSIAR